MIPRESPDLVDSTEIFNAIQAVTAPPVEKWGDASEIDANDITTNLPYVPGCHLAFDHHLSETVRNVERADNHIINADAPSAARVVCHTNVGELCLSYGGGHLNASICQVDNDQAESALTEIVERINADG